VVRVEARMRGLEAADAAFPVVATAYGSGANTAYRISVNGKPLFNIIADDLDPADGLSLQQSATNVVQGSINYGVTICRSIPPGRWLSRQAMVLRERWFLLHAQSGAAPTASCLAALCHCTRISYLAGFGDG
jgi:hypothetical protein